jgi:hypothetical protein
VVRREERGGSQARGVVGDGHTTSRQRKWWDQAATLLCGRFRAALGVAWVRDGGRNPVGGWQSGVGHRDEMGGKRLG